jgi:hypothetical protein
MLRFLQIENPAGNTTNPVTAFAHMGVESNRRTKHPCAKVVQDEITFVNNVGIFD